MFKLKVLCKEETEKALKMSDVIHSIEEVYKQKALGDTEAFSLIFHEFTPGVADMDIKSGWIKGSGLFGLKLVSWFGENVNKQLSDSERSKNFCRLYQSMHPCRRNRNSH